MTTYTQCRYLRRSGEQCTGEVADEQGEILLCQRHLALALADQARHAHHRDHPGAGHDQGGDRMTDTLTPPVPIIVSTDRTPVEKAVISEILDDFGPLKYLLMTFYGRDAARIRHAWTSGGDKLGDQIDDEALARGLVAADGVVITASHYEEHHRGSIQIVVFDLPPIAGNLRAGVRDDGTYRERFGRLAAAVDAPGWVMPWFGYGPQYIRSRR